MLFNRSLTTLFAAVLFCSSVFAQGSRAASGPAKPISPDLFGIFFEDISYAADGGLYAELVQNRSFEYTPNDRRGWHSLTGWEYVTEGYGYGMLDVETSSPLHPNNPHYIVLKVEEPGQQGIGVSNTGYDGIYVRKGERYDFSLFARVLNGEAIPLVISLRGAKGEVYGEAAIRAEGDGWKKYTATVTAGSTDTAARLVVLAKGKGTLAMDVISLFPEKTFRNRPNGLRNDLAEKIAELHPKFMRFPGGCLVHGDGLGNMYRWKNTIGPVEQRVEQRDIWNYHQTAGLGYFEYFQFCEDIGAKPLPIVAAGVSCQNSGGTWRIGSTGQKGFSMEEMQEYIQEVLDLIEYANGSPTSTWGAKRAAAGHPAPFGLQYIGIGNEDKQTDVFRDRFKMLYEAVKAKHPEITVVGTVGPSPAGEDYNLGWKFAGELGVPVVDEHYYEKPEWFLTHNKRYDSYDRARPKVYVGEYASWGNALFNALAEAAYMTGLERNGDLVRMASYAPLLANQHHTSWNPNLIYFTNTAILPTVNYYVQQLFSVNSGDWYYSNAVAFRSTKAGADTLLAASCVKDSKSGDIILKIVNAGNEPEDAFVHLKGLGALQSQAELYVLTGARDGKNSFEEPALIAPARSALVVKGSFSYNAPPYSLSVIRVHAKK